MDLVIILHNSKNLSPCYSFISLQVFNSLINMKSCMKINLVLFLTLLCTGFVHGQSVKQVKVYRLNIRDEINKGMAREVAQAITEARSIKADLLLIDMNTYGGLLDAADSIRTSLLNLEIPSVVFINNNAASAGALISISCNRIYMRKGASIGAATVVDQNGAVVPDKYQSYMRSMMRSTAQARGRDPKIAEAMVDPRTYIPGINDSGKVLTMTSAEAIKNNYCNGQAENIAEVMKLEKIEHYTITEYKPTWVDLLISFLINPAVSGVLILLMLGGIYYELQAPGIGLPLMIAVGAAVLYFAPLYLEGLAENWEVLVALAGFILIVLEIFVIPGFGVAGISGILFLVFGLTVSMLGNDGFDFSGLSIEKIAVSFAVVLVSMSGAVLLFIFTGKALTASPAFNKMVLHNSMPSGEGFHASSAELHQLPGKSGVTLNMLRPAGKVEIEGQIYDARANSGFIDGGKKIIVVRAELGGVFVKEAEDIYTN
jgi:membrane-bound serine protease (ClpP class)